MTDWSRFRRLLPFLRRDAWLYLVALACAPASAVLVIAQPWLLKLAIDDHIVPGDVAGLRTVALAYLGAVLLAFVLEATYVVTLSYAAIRTIARLREAIYAHTLSLARSFFDREPTGRLLTRVTSDVEALGETLTAGAITIVLDGIVVVGILIAMVSMDARLTLVMLLVAPPLVVVVEVIRRVLRRLYLAVRTHHAALNAYTAERLSGIETVQLYSDEARAVRGFDAHLYRYRDAAVRTNVWDALLYAIVDGLTAVTVALILWYASGGALGDAVTAGLLAAFIDYVTKLFRPVQEFSAKLAILQRAASALEKIFGLLDTDEHLDPGTVPLEAPEGSIDLREVCFAYGDGPDVLHGVSLHVRPGETVAVVGRTGSGKTTIGKLLTRAYQGYRGHITVDGEELSGLALADVRRAIGVVPQDVDLFPGDVRFNLALGHALADEDLERAIEMVHASEVVDKLGGLDGHLAYQGGNVSVGEGQLLSFARTMAHDPPLVILDEATASVDSLTEARIQAATEAVLERKTVLVIAHRLSTVLHADRIAVMDAGRVVELGSHDELMERDGVYSDLFRQQFEEGPALS